MGLTNSQFEVHVRFLIRDLEDARKETDLDKKNEILDKVMQDLQIALED